MNYWMTPCARRRAEMSLHSRHTLSGMTPIFIKPANILHPTQNPNAASRNAGPARAAVTQRDAVFASNRYKTDAVMLNSAPIPCANRFGGPGTMRCGPDSRGVMTWVAIRAIGLKVGPDNTLATKPYVRGIRIQDQPVTEYPAAMRTAALATMRAEVSFTSVGKLSSLVTFSS